MCLYQVSQYLSTPLLLPLMTPFATKHVGWSRNPWHHCACTPCWEFCIMYFCMPFYKPCLWKCFKPVLKKDIGFTLFGALLHLHAFHYDHCGDGELTLIPTGYVYSGPSFHKRILTSHMRITLYLVILRVCRWRTHSDALIIIMRMKRIIVCLFKFYHNSHCA